MKKNILFIWVILTGILATNVFSSSVEIFGPTKWVRTNGAPNVYTAEFTDTFRIPAEGKLTIFSGTEEGEHRVSSAEVYCNGEKVFQPADFKQKTYTLEAPVVIDAENTIRVVLRSEPDSFLIVKITREIELPTVHIDAEPDAVRLTEFSTISWVSSNAQSVILNQNTVVDPTGSLSISPTVETLYEIKAVNPAGTATDNVLLKILNTPPEALPQSVTVAEDASVSITLDGTDVDLDQLSFQIASGPLHGILSGNPPALIYTPNENFNGEDTFSFKVHDTEGPGTYGMCSIWMETGGRSPPSTG